jgi:predicted DNA-binding protein
MVTEQFSIRLPRATKAKIVRNARIMGKKPAEYARELLEKDEELITGEELHRRLMRYVRGNKTPLVAKR